MVLLYYFGYFCVRYVPLLSISPPISIRVLGIKLGFASQMPLQAKQSGQPTLEVIVMRKAKYPF